MGCHLLCRQDGGLLNSPACATELISNLYSRNIRVYWHSMEGLVALQITLKHMIPLNYLLGGGGNFGYGVGESEYRTLSNKIDGVLNGRLP